MSVERRKLYKIPAHAQAAMRSTLSSSKTCILCDGRKVVGAYVCQSCWHQIYRLYDYADEIAAHIMSCALDIEWEKALHG